MSYHPDKYYAGLSESKKRKRRKEIERRSQLDWDDPKAYDPWETNEGVVTRPSKYNQDFADRYENPREASWEKSLRKKARQSGIPLDLLRRVMLRGMAAWRTGHRPGASQIAWGLARVNSFATGGKTYWTADQDVARAWKQRTGEYFDRAGRRRRKNPRDMDLELNKLCEVLDSLPRNTSLSEDAISAILIFVANSIPKER